MADTDPQPLTETEEMLADDPDAKGMMALVDGLEATQAEVKKAIDGGLPPDEFKQAEAVGQALGTAKEIAAKTWAQVNKT